MEWMDTSHLLKGVLERMGEELRLFPTAVEPLGIAAWNSHYRLELEGRPHHLVIYTLPDPTATEGLIFEHKILRHLQQSHFDLIPRLVLVNRNSLFSFEGGWYAITEWIDGCRQAGDPPLTPRQLESMAAGLAHLHRYLATADYQLRYHPDHVFVYPLPQFHQQWEQLITRLQGKLAAGAPFDEAAIHAWSTVRWRVEKLFREFPLDLYWQVRQQDPTQVVHGDFRGQNAAFEGDRLTRILDFNCCFNEIRLWDVAYTALGLGGAETIGGRLELERPARFIAAYHRQGRLTRQEQELLPTLLNFVAAKLTVAAFAAWCITDRAELITRLAEGAADEIVRRALP